MKSQEKYNACLVTPFKSLRIIRLINMESNFICAICVEKEVFNHNGEINNATFLFARIVEWKHSNKDMEVVNNDLY